MGSLGQRKRVHLTGYGPFAGYEVNPSAVIVERLVGQLTDGLPGIDLSTEVLEVTYDSVQQFCARCRQNGTETLYVHLGVHPIKQNVRLESLSFRDGYIMKDVKGCVPFLNCCVPCPAERDKQFDAAPPCLKTTLDLGAMINSLVEAEEFQPLQIEVSSDPGRYLCAFIYYRSLMLSNGRSLFIHVPEFDAKISPEMLAKLVKEIILMVVAQTLGTMEEWVEEGFLGE